MFGCVSTRGDPEFAQQLASTQATMELANQHGAAQDSRAAQQLRLAKEQIDHAQDLLKQGEDEAAHDMLLRARSDAELAVALSDESRQYAEAQAVLQRLNTIEQKGGQR
jgi:hypothetical protein